MHKQKWSNNKPSITLFELKHYIEDLKDLRNKIAKRIYRLFNPFPMEMFCKLSPVVGCLFYFLFLFVPLMLF